MQRVRLSSIINRLLATGSCAQPHCAHLAALQQPNFGSLARILPSRTICTSNLSLHDHHRHAHQHEHQHAHKHEQQHNHELTEEELACWSCHQHLKRGGLVCNSCEKIQPVDSSLTYFELLGLPKQTFDIDTAKLERRYKRLQWSLHPDKSVGKNASEKEFSAEQATLVNRAYGVLKSPLSRANYMLALQGVEAGENFEGTISDHELLMEVMEAREEVEETTDKLKLHHLMQANKQQQDAVVQQLSKAFAEGDVSRSVELTTHLTYLVKLGQAIIDKI